MAGVASNAAFGSVLFTLMINTVNYSLQLYVGTSYEVSTLILYLFLLLLLREEKYGN